MRSFSYIVIVVLAVLVQGRTASARIQEAEDPGTLARKSDVIAVGHVMAVKDTAEETVLPGISPPVKVHGVETTFFADNVFKGEVANRVIVLHHYRLQDPFERMRGGPLLIRFVPHKYRYFLLYLKREPDGRCVPAGGQVDSAISVLRTMNEYEGLEKMAEDERTDKRDADRRIESIQQKPDAPVVLEFVKMETEDGVRRQARMKVINKTAKDVSSYGLQVVFFREDGSVADGTSTATNAAVGHSVVRAHGEAVLMLTGRTDNYDTVRAQAVVTSVTFTDGSRWSSQ